MRRLPLWASYLLLTLPSFVMLRMRLDSWRVPLLISMFLLSAFRDQCAEYVIVYFYVAVHISFHDSKPC